MSSTTEFIVTVFAISAFAFAAVAIAALHDRKKKAQRELDALNAEYKNLVYEMRHTFDGELPDHEPR